MHTASCEARISRSPARMSRPRRSGTSRFERRSGGLRKRLPRLSPHPQGKTVTPVSRSLHDERRPMRAAFQQAPCPCLRLLLPCAMGTVRVPLWNRCQAVRKPSRLWRSQTDVQPDCAICPLLLPVMQYSASSHGSAMRILLQMDPARICPFGQHFHRYE